MASTIQVRIERSALDAWRAVLGVHLKDGAAANSAIRYAVEAKQRETAAKPDGEVPDR